jgi:hypothetical protein
MQAVSYLIRHEEAQVSGRQLVELAPPLRRHSLGVYQILALLPVEQGEPQYRASRSLKLMSAAH